MGMRKLFIYLFGVTKGLELVIYSEQYWFALAKDLSSIFVGGGPGGGWAETQPLPLLLFDPGHFISTSKSFPS